MDSMSGCDIRLVFTFPPKDNTLQYKKCVHLWNNFPCFSTLANATYLQRILNLFDVNIFKSSFSNLVNLRVETVEEPQSPSWSETAKHGKGYDFYQHLFILISIYFILMCINK